MSSLGKVSKFSVLKVEDASSSDDDGFKQALGPRKGQKKPQPKMPSVTPRGPNAKKLQDGLVVHAVPTGNKNKKKSKAKVIDEATGFVVQDADENYNAEKKYQDQLKEALRESQNLAEETAKQQKERTPEEAAVAAIEKELAKSKINSSSVHDQLLSLQKQAIDAREEAEQYKTKIDYYRGRYKKIVELLRDSEVHERAQLVMKLNQSRQVEADLGEQVVELQAHLEKARSRINQLENK